MKVRLMARISGSFDRHEHGCYLNNDWSDENPSGTKDEAGD